ncbi:MAG: hypothetical protein Q9199_001235 [Rusavskia elegans]
MTKVPGSFKAVATIAPVREAAAALEDFFMDLYEAVQTTWSNQPRHRTVVYDNNGFSLLITAMGDTIPWEFVQQLALNGWTFAARGFTDLFDVMYANANGNIMVSVSLRLLDHALPGSEPGTGSGESSQTGWAGGADGSGDWREGSVPSVGSGADANNMNWGGTR